MDSPTSPPSCPSRTDSKKKKTGVLYLSSLPPHMSVLRLREQFNTYSGNKVGRISLVESKKPNKNKKPKKNVPRNYSEGWIEILSKHRAKLIAEQFNNQPMGGRKKNRWYDFIWNIKYLSGFKWTHLTEQLQFERAVRQERLRTEIALAKKEANFYVESVERSQRLARKPSKDGATEPLERVFRQNLTTEEILKKKGLTLGREDRLVVMKSAGLFGDMRAPVDDNT